jgi:hypothetical protein
MRSEGYVKTTSRELPYSSTPEFMNALSSSRARCLHRSVARFLLVSLNFGSRLHGRPGPAG